MRDIILKALGELNIPVYQIEISEERSAELFFIKKDPGHAPYQERGPLRRHRLPGL